MVLIPNSNIVVDGFKYSTDLNRPQYVYFLTHMHADHYAGLSDSWDQGVIYCSRITKLLLLRKFPRLSSVKELELDEMHWISLREDHSDGTNVTLIDANHCPGAVMLLFQGKMGTVLHTGDFRYSPDMLTHRSLQCSTGGLIPLDLVFLDNTYCNPTHTFPSRSEIIAKTIEIIEAEKGADVEIGVDNLGKEDLLVALAEHFKVRIHVGEEKFQEIQMLEFNQGLFTTDAADTWIHVVPKTDLKLINEKVREGRKVIGLSMSGWCDQVTKVCAWLYVTLMQKLPYSLHSNYAELVAFVEATKPKNIVFTVPSSATDSGAAEFLRKYSYQAPSKKPKGSLLFEVNPPQGALKRRIPTAQQGQVPKSKKPKILGSRICN